MSVYVCVCVWGVSSSEDGIPDENDLDGGDVLRWDGIVVFPNASKLAKLVFESPWGAAATHKENIKTGNEWQSSKQITTQHMKYMTANQRTMVFLFIDDTLVNIISPRKALILN